MAGILGLLLAGVAALAVLLTTGGSSGRAHETRGGSPRGHTTTTRSVRTPPPIPAPANFGVGLRVLHLQDTSRTITLPDGATEARPLLTYVRYPSTGAPGQTDVTDAPAASSQGPFPLIVFGHGFNVMPSLYARLLQAWARAGYVVAAPVFPLENPEAPGGPDEADLPNQPADMSFVISSILEASAAPGGPLSGLVDPREVAVAGQSDGGDTALAVAYDPTYRDPRVDGAVILSGAEIPGLSSFAFPAGGPPLLATQGTADTVNPPESTYSFFAAAKRPKYLLKLLGAAHLPPYTTQEPQLGIVERVSIDFLNSYLKGQPKPPGRLARAGNLPGVATLRSEP